MTQEEKAKAYDEALERAEALIAGETNTSDTLFYLNDIKSIFPELSESEDEKIRKELIQFIKNWKDHNNIGRPHDFPTLTRNVEQCDRYIAWLEKQKEFVSADFDDVWDTADCDELTVPLEQYSKDAIKEMCHAWYDKGIELERKSWLEKQDEQYVPSKEIILNVWELGNIWKEITKGVCNTEHGTQLEFIIKHWNEGEHYTEWLEKQGQQPKKVSIWKHWKDGIAGGAEGEQIFLTKIGRIYSISSCLGCECDYIELSELDNLLSDKQEPKPKWSEEDERHYTTIIKALHSSGAITPIDMELAEKWFKSLKKMMEEQQ